jgi:uncharacterized membrane protein YgcG
MVTKIFILGIFVIGFLFLLVWFIGYLMRRISPDNRAENFVETNVTSYVSSDSGGGFGNGDSGGGFGSFGGGSSGGVGASGGW